MPKGNALLTSRETLSFNLLPTVGHHYLTRLAAAMQRQVGGDASTPVVPPGSRSTSPTGPPLLAVAANAGSSSVPRGHDSPGPAVIDQRLPQQIGCLLLCRHLLRKIWPRDAGANSTSGSASHRQFARGPVDGAEKVILVWDVGNAGAATIRRQGAVASMFLAQPDGADMAAFTVVRTRLAPR